MPLVHIDKIVSLTPGQSIKVVKSLHASEEYLQDHFPHFPVMPGVMMLETLIQAGSWLLRVTDDFKYSMVRLVEAKGLKYQDFVSPGQTLTVEVSLTKRDDKTAQLKAQGTIADGIAVTGRLIMSSANLSGSADTQTPQDKYICMELRKELSRLWVP